MRKTLEPIELEEVGSLNTWLTTTLVAGLVGLVVWAALSNLDIVSIAQGTVTPSSRVQTVQHLEGGIVREVLVEEGSSVTKGQPLVNLDTTATKSDFGELMGRSNYLSITLTRLEAEKTEKTELDFGKFENINQESANKERALFFARRKRLQTNIFARVKERAQHQEDIKKIMSRLKNGRARLVLVTEQVKIGEKLIKNQLSNRYEQLERLKEQNTLQAKIDEDQFSLVRAKEGVLALQAEVESVTNKFREEVLTEQSKVRQQLNEVTERIKKYGDNLKRTVLRAPMAGTVKTIYVSTEGGVVSPGGVVMDLVPQDDTLVIEAKLPPQDIGHVKAGQRAFFQLASAEAMQFGRIEGVVDYISPDTVQSKDGAPYYTVRVQTNETAFHNGERRYELVPGVAVSVGIITGQRSVLAYFLGPLLHTFPFALSER